MSFPYIRSNAMSLALNISHFRCIISLSYHLAVWYWWYANNSGYTDRADRGARQPRKQRTSPLRMLSCSGIFFALWWCHLHPSSYPCLQVTVANGADQISFFLQKTGRDIWVKMMFFTFTTSLVVLSHSFYIFFKCWHIFIVQSDTFYEDFSYIYYI